MSYWVELVQFLQSQFEYKGFEKGDPPPEFIEKCLMMLFIFNASKGKVLVLIRLQQLSVS